MNAIRARGGWCYKVHGNEFTPAGTPDIVCCYRGVFVAFETKTPTGGEPTEIQLYRHKRIRRADGVVGVPRSVADAMAVLDALDDELDA